jgi:hypothetical protein
VDDDELLGVADNAVAHFGDDSDDIVIELEGGLATIRLSLVELVDDALDVMATDQEADDMLDMARHFQFLAKRIKQTVEEHEQSRGEP